MSSLLSLFLLPPTAVRTPPKLQPYTPFHPPPSTDVHMPPAPPPVQVQFNSGHRGVAGGRALEPERKREMGRREGGGRQKVGKDIISRSKPPVGVYIQCLCVLGCVFVHFNY